MLRPVSALPVGTVPGPGEETSVNPDLIQFSVIPVEPSPEGFVPGPVIHFKGTQKRMLHLLTMCWPSTWDCWFTVSCDLWFCGSALAELLLGEALRCRLCLWSWWC